MKLTKYIYGVALGVLSLSFASCYNADKEFPDFEGGTTAYFAYQFPVRTIILGNDIYDNTLDNAHKCQIWSTMGGAYNGRNAVVEIAVDNSLCDNLFFPDEGGNAASPVLPMPAEYYKLASNSIPYNGDVRGKVEVQLTDAFFNDPKSMENTYVIPIVMKNVSGIDHILTGTPRESDAVRQNTSAWDVLAKDYVLYCVKYMNPWQGRYIRRGQDKITEGAADSIIIRMDTTLIGSDPGRYTENPVNANDEVCSIITKDMKTCLFPTSIRRITYDMEDPQNPKLNPAISCTLILTFDGNKCTITTEDDDATVVGTGEFIVNGTEQAAYKEFQWGSMNGKPVQRDILRLSYNVTFNKGKYLYTKKDKAGKDVKVYLKDDMTVAASDTLVVQTRESNKKEFFTPLYIK